MCNIGKAISRMFTPPGTGALDGAIQQALAQVSQGNAAAAASSAAATDALTQAITASTKAATPIADSASARDASVDQMRRLMAMQGSSWSFQNTPMAMPSVATKQLLGI